MAPRTRKYRGLEPNLYQGETKGTTYYRYLHPLTGKFHGMGTNKAKANAAARILNAKLIPNTGNLVDQVLGTAGKDFAYLVERFRNEILHQKKLAPGTRQSYEYRLNRLDVDLGKRQILDFTVQDCAEYLDGRFNRNSYVKHRHTLVELFRFAVVKGLRDDNPAEVTYSNTADDKQRQRMTMAQFKALHAAAPIWMQIAMELALITLQGRWEICHMRFDQVKDGSLYVVREKTKDHDWSRLQIGITPQLQTVIQRARQSGIASPYLVHRRPQRVKPNQETDHWSQLAPNTFTAEFRKLRDSLPMFSSISREQRPTFHEIRALGSHLYEKAGFSRDYVQKLMAHGDEKMTEHYQSGHEVRWLAVQAGLDIEAVMGSK